jgi:hypothetical protein
MFRVLNDIGIAGDVEPDEAHDPLDKDVRPRSRHHELRAAPA